MSDISMLDRRAALEIIVEAPDWSDEPEAEATIRRAVAAARLQTRADGEVCVLLTNDAAIRELNRTWRQLDKPTNVLSFPSQNHPHPDSPMLGDVAIAYETTAREARADGKPLLHHLAHLTVHGFLHLLGYDHEDDGQAEIMERLERAILVELGV